jgi:hypothetical protein
VDPGDYDPVLGHSYSEIAGMSRSMHRSQGMGTSERKGSNRNYLMPVAGEPAASDIFDGIDTTWNRFPGGAALGRELGEAARAFDPTNPAKTVPSLLAAQKMLAELHGAELHQPVLDLKQRELEETIALCAGLWLDATADRFAVVPGGALKLSATALNRERLAVRVESVDVEGMAKSSAKDAGGALPFNAPKVYPLDITVPGTEPLSQPYWLREPTQGDTYTVSDQTEIGLAENPPLLRAHFHLRIESNMVSNPVEIVRPVIYRYVERAQGELTRALVVEPPVALQWSEEALLFPNPSAKGVELEVRANVASAAGEVRIKAPSGWNVTPQSQSFRLSAAGQESPLSFRLTPAAQDSKGALEATAKVGDQTVAVGMEAISYPHIPPQVLFRPARTELVRSDVRLLAKTIGYVMGAGDEVPAALRQMGAEVTLLGADGLSRGDLGHFDAIVTGVRAYNTRADLRANQERLMEYVRNGGTLVVQYNAFEGSGPAPPGRGRGGGSGENEPSALDHIGPYPMVMGRDRVTVEDAPVKFPTPGSPLLHKPNEITARDFEGWVQERGLNFASQWDSHYQPLFETHDPGEKPLLGGTLYTRYGKGAYVFTAFSWFRELPSGVPGAFRIFANLLSAGKTL